MNVETYEFQRHALVPKSISEPQAEILPPEPKLTAADILDRMTERVHVLGRGPFYDEAASGRLFSDNHPAGHHEGVWLIVWVDPQTFDDACAFKALREDDEEDDHGEEPGDAEEGDDPAEDPDVTEEDDPPEDNGDREEDRSDFEHELQGFCNPGLSINGPTVEQQLRSKAADHPK